MANYASCYNKMFETHETPYTFQTPRIRVISLFKTMSGRAYHTYIGFLSESIANGYHVHAG